VNCETSHRYLLALERPDAPPPDLRSHLAVCAACRDWHARLLQMEREAAQIPVPAPREKNAFVERFLAEGRPATAPALRDEKSGKTVPAVLRFPSDAQPSLANGSLKSGKRERGLQKMAVAVALAAALLLVTFGIWAWQRGNNSTPVNPNSPERLSALEQRLRDTPRWAEAQTPNTRLEVLSHLADETNDKAQSLARTGTTEGLAAEVRLYREIIDRITAREALEVAPADRERVLSPIVHRLAEVESQAGRLALEVPAASTPLRELAAAAREGGGQLRAILRQRA